MKKSIIVALDEFNMDSCKNILDKLNNNLCLVKVGSVAFNSLGHQIINEVSERGFEIFLDLKFNDIPNTVSKSIFGIRNLPIKMLTVHISGGKEMLDISMEAVKGTDIKIFGVTVLTSLNNKDTNTIFKRDPDKQVLSMLDIAEQAKIDGIVCSPHELEIVVGRKKFQTITPGIRPYEFDDDQSRVMTPKEAIKLGADFIVIGRPITKSNDITKSLEQVYQSIL